MGNSQVSEEFSRSETEASVRQMVEERIEFISGQVERISAKISRLERTISREATENRIDSKLERLAKLLKSEKEEIEDELRGWEVPFSPMIRERVRAWEVTPLLQNQENPRPREIFPLLQNREGLRGWEIPPSPLIREGVRGWGVSRSPLIIEEVKGWEIPASPIREKRIKSKDVFEPSATKGVNYLDAALSSSDLYGSRELKTPEKRNSNSHTNEKRKGVISEAKEELLVSGLKSRYFPGSGVKAELAQERRDVEESKEIRELHELRDTRRPLILESLKELGEMSSTFPTTQGSRTELGVPPKIVRKAGGWAVDLSRARDRYKLGKLKHKIEK